MPGGCGWAHGCQLAKCNHLRAVGKGLYMHRQLQGYAAHACRITPYDLQADSTHPRHPATLCHTHHRCSAAQAPALAGKYQCQQQGLQPQDRPPRTRAKVSNAECSLGLHHPEKGHQTTARMAPACPGHVHLTQSSTKLQLHLAVQKPPHSLTRVTRCHQHLLARPHTSHSKMGLRHQPCS